MTTFNRRKFLRGLGASACLMPLMPSHVFGATQPIKRFIFVYSANGTIPDAWRPGSGYKFGAILKPLEDLKQKTMVIRNVNLETTHNTDIGSAHSRGIGHLLTGIDLLPGPFKGGSGKPCGWAGGISVDQYIGKALRQKHKLLYDSLTLGVDCKGNQVRTTVSYTAKNTPKLPENDPYKVYKDLFGQVSGTQEELRNLRERRKSVLDFVNKDLGRLKNQLGSADQLKLEAHLGHIRQIEGRLDQVADDTCNPEPPQPGTDPKDKDDKFFPQVSDLQMEMLVAALACDVTRVATLQFSTATSSQTFPWLDITDKHHTLSHEGDSNKSAKDKLIKINTWFAKQVAKLAQKLADTPEGDGSMLDNTVIVWGNSLGKGNNHTRRDIPYLMVGDAGGYFKSGQAVDTKGAAHNDLLTSLCYAMDVEPPKNGKFGDPKYCSGRLKVIEK